MKKFLNSIFYIPNSTSQSGQSLVMVLFFIVFAISITTAAVTMLIVNAKSITVVEQGLLTYTEAESGLENAILRLLRNPSYTGETLAVGSATVTTTVSGTSTTKTVTARSVHGNFVRTVQAQVTYSGGIFTISSWQEIP